MPARTFTFLGCGTSTGVPVLGCECTVCKSTNPKNRRNRCAAVIGTSDGNILIDTPPEIRLELLAANIGIIHSTIYTHYHADHLYGLDDLRQFPRLIGGPMPVYCADDVEAAIRTTFGYVFAAPSAEGQASYVPKLEFRRIRGGESFRVLNQNVLPIPLVHAQFRVLGFRIGDIAYCTDVNRIPEGSMEFLRNLKVLVLDALRIRPHPAHFGLQEALELIRELKPERAWLTHMSHDLEYEETNAKLPAHVRLAYDGLSFEF
jgi:phosphoribosyl 1,2-cyclic phosphate phosphodiesterase